MLRNGDVKLVPQRFNKIVEALPLIYRYEGFRFWKSSLMTTRSFAVHVKAGLTFWYLLLMNRCGNIVV
jgi:hypothetical protein